jgi:hypothetical protein
MKASTIAALILIALFIMFCTACADTMGRSISVSYGKAAVSYRWERK